MNDKKHSRNGYGGTSSSSNGVSGLFNEIKSSFKLFASSNTPKKIDETSTSTSSEKANDLFSTDLDNELTMDERVEFKVIMTTQPHLANIFVKMSVDERKAYIRITIKK